MESKQLETILNYMVQRDLGNTDVYLYLHYAKANTSTDMESSRQRQQRMVCTTCKTTPRTTEWPCLPTLNTCPAHKHRTELGSQSKVWVER